MFSTRFTVAFLLGIMFTATIVAAAPEKSEKPTNVVLILADNLGYHDAGCYGNRENLTPHIDRLATQGVRCTGLYSASPTCAVSRAALLTGRYPQRNGLTHQLRTTPDMKIDENLGVGLRHSEKLIPQYLKPLGYATACFGKWNIGFAPGSRPTERGFDEFLGHASGNMDYYTYIYKGRNDLFRGIEPAKTKGYSTDLFADAACDFIRQNADGPFFLYVPFNAVHYPNPNNKAPGKPCIWQAPDKYFDMYGYSPDTRNEKQRYQAIVTALDDGVGRIIGQLDKLGLKENTLVIFFSDNGAFAAQMNVASNKPFRTSTVMIYEGSIRVCGMVRWPGVIKPNTVCYETLISLDFLPLILRATGAKPIEGIKLDGADPTGVLAGEAKSPHDSLYWQYNGSDAVRSGRYKLIKPRKPKDTYRLYDLVSDPGETKNLIDEKPEIAANLKRDFENWEKSVKE